MCLIPALGRKRQADLCEFKTSLLYRVSSRTGFEATEKPCLQKPREDKAYSNHIHHTSVIILTQCGTSEGHIQEQHACFVPGTRSAPRSPTQRQPFNILDLLLGQKPNNVLQLLTDHPGTRRESGQQGTLSIIHIRRCRRLDESRYRWSPYH